MTTIETTIEVDDEGKTTIRLPAELAPGRYRAVVLIESREADAAHARLVFSAHVVGPWPEGFTVRREDMYGDDGR